MSSVNPNENRDKSTNQIYESISHVNKSKNKTEGLYSSYGGSREKLCGDSHIIAALVQINGNDYFNQTNIKLRLIQKQREHHTFELIADPDEFSENRAYLFQNSKNYLGSRITIQFRQFGKTASIFTGIITQISTHIKDGIKQIVLSGKSPSILMENGLNSRSFENKTLEDIIREVIKDYPQDLMNFDINTNIKEPLKYITQYNQSDFDFLKNLTSRFGEYFCYQGEKFVVSHWGGNIVELMEGEDFHDYKLNMEIESQKFSYSAYDPKQNSIYTLDSENYLLQQSENPFQQIAYKASEKFFKVIPTCHYNHNLLQKNQEDIEKAIQIQKKKKQNLVYLKVKTNHPGLRLNDVCKMMVWMPEHEIFKDGKLPIESYKIISIEHNYADGEGYYNIIKGVPKDLSVPPDFDEYEFPKAQIQHAIVTDNKDPLKMGRVRVQFSWQKPNNSQTPWIQVIQPHAGNEKGTYINPEINETVLCAFHGGNAEYPVVLGTAYNGGEISAYYTDGNDIKVIQTRSGTKIIFNDAEGAGSIIIEDPSGNRMFMDGEGNIKVNVPKNMDFIVGNDLSFNVGNNISFDAEANIFNSAGINISQVASKDIIQTASGNICESSDNRSETVQNKFIKVSKTSHKLSDEMNITSLKKDMLLQSTQKVFLNSNEKSNLF